MLNYFINMSTASSVTCDIVTAANSKMITSMHSPIVSGIVKQPTPLSASLDIVLKNKVEPNNKSIESKDPYVKTINGEFTLKSFEINNRKYKLTIKTYIDGEIYIYMKEIVTEIKYELRKSAKEIMLLTQEAECVLNTKQFFDILATGFENKPGVKVNSSIDLSLGTINFEVVFIILVGLDITKTFNIKLSKINQNESERLDAIVRNVCAKSENLDDIQELLSKYDQRIAAIENHLWIEDPSKKSEDSPQPRLDDLENSLQQVVSDMSDCNDKLSQVENKLNKDYPSHSPSKMNRRDLVTSVLDIETNIYVLSNRMSVLEKTLEKLKDGDRENSAKLLGRIEALEHRNEHTDERNQGFVTREEVQDIILKNL